MTAELIGAEIGGTAASIDEVFDWAYDQGWTDGLPIVPPTPDRVQAMMATVDLAPDHVVAQISPRRAEATVERLAANAVMAGCRPEYFPVIVAAIEALVADGDQPYGWNTTTSPVAPMIMVNGPIRNEIGINCSWSCLGPGARANATIGRAVSLAMINIGGRIPGVNTKSTHAQPGRYTFCFGEFEEETPWAPLHVERGFKPDESTVTIMGATGTLDVIDIDSESGEEVLHTMASGMMAIGSNNMFPSYSRMYDLVVIWCPDHAKLIGETYTKKQAQEYLLEATSKRVPTTWETERRLKTMSERGGQIENGFVRLAQRADQFVFVVAGGHGGFHSQVCHGFGYAVTVPIKYRRT